MRTVALTSGYWALRAAQISLMNEKNWQAPYYWAAFTLQGERR
jgi:CHAT domain-containing protein